MIVNNSYAYAEVLEILEYMDNIYVEKIPNKLITLFKNNANQGYIKHINPTLEFYKQKLSNDTLIILAIINLKYWIKDDEKKQKILNSYKENEKTSNVISSIQFNSEKMFSTEKKDDEYKELAVNNALPITKKDDGLLNKIINFIKKIICKIIYIKN